MANRYFDNSQLAEAVRIASGDTKGVSHINKFGFGAELAKSVIALKIDYIKSREGVFKTLFINVIKSYIGYNVVLFLIAFFGTLLPMVLPYMAAVIIFQIISFVIGFILGRIIGRTLISLIVMFYPGVKEREDPKNYIKRIKASIERTEGKERSQEVENELDELEALVEESRNTDSCYTKIKEYIFGETDNIPSLEELTEDLKENSLFKSGNVLPTN